MDKQNIGERINLVIDNLSNKLGVTVNKIYPTLIKQSYIEGMSGIILFVLSIIIGIVCFKTILKYWKCWNENHVTKETILTAVSFLFGIISVMLFIVQLTQLQYNLSRLINPEWHAIEKILMLLK
jgi:hypothetical protein